MEESDQILLKSLQHSGLAIPDEVSSIKDFTPTTLFLICSQSLRILNYPSVFPPSLPDSMADRFKICSEIASAIQTLGYVGDISFHKFLYPSEEDLYKLVRFMVAKLSEFAEAGKVPDANYIDATPQMNGEKDESTSNAWINNEVFDISTGKFGDRLNDLRLKTEAPALNVNDGDALISGSYEAQVIPQKLDTESVAVRLRSGFHVSDEKELIRGQKATESAEQSISAPSNAEAVIELDEKLKHLQEQSSKLQNDITNLHDLEKHLKAEVTMKTSEVQQIETEHELLKVAAEMAFDDQHTIDVYIQQLNQQLDTRKQKVANLESEWNDLIMPLEEKRRSLQESVHETKPQVWEKLQKSKEAETEAHRITSEIKRSGHYALVTQQPLRGRAKQGGQRVGEMEVWALEGFGVAHILQEMLTYKSDHIRARQEVLGTTIIGGTIPNPEDAPESFRLLVRELRSLALELNHFLVLFFSSHSHAVMYAVACSVLWEHQDSNSLKEKAVYCREFRKSLEEEILKLSEDLKKQPKVAPGKYYIDRIKEITKNSWKQDGDIERILKETRELQLESNSIQERLHRSYAVVDEMVFREAKSDPVGRQAYRLLTSIHESFEQISEKILFTDRTRREVAEYEAKLAAMASRSLKIHKLQADLDAIKMENNYLEKPLLSASEFGI
ncbi:Coiled-coil domain-containing protein 22 [Dillenia turbinata]|uniref:Coiled-coil domain-containing protein 22 n=1 Tax=Dillenia turbinata TaxID=194707 RepID=A0AAN8VRZ6_9MAGN